MELALDEIILRDYRLSDVEDEVRWTNVDTAWFCTTTPWMEMTPVDPQELRADMAEVISEMTEDKIRMRFEIEVVGRHIGTMSSYYLSEDFESMPYEKIDYSKNAEENHAVRALGIEICEMDYWGKGLGAKALTCVMDYYRDFGEHRFILETWTGNTRMLGCAKKLGFKEVLRRKDAYTVNGKQYDEVVLEKVS
ncbi:MAG: GNAT family N-acetyltransferase [Lachnospiraceae bacterium]|nr:GNAT family N-acetyltransferase [Lachnospiraceae bacterium]